MADGSDIFLPIGFIPDYFRLCDINSAITNNAVTITEWFAQMEQDEASGRQEGWTHDLATIAYITLNSNDQGISAFDTGSVSPAAGEGAGQLSEWASTTSYVAKTATARGSFVKGTVGATNNIGGVVDREAIFENVGSTGNSGSTEPSWPTAVGDQILDSTPIWELVVDVPVKQGGYQGVAIRGEIQTDSHEFYYLALKSHDSVDHGDVDGWPSGVDPDWS